MEIKSVEERWEEGIGPTERSYDFVEKLRSLDEKYNNGRLTSADTFELGGDGDYGEDLAYLLDIYFEGKE